MEALCSKRALEEAGKWPPLEPGGNPLSHNLDRLNQNWDKVPLNFTPHTPMAYNKKRERHICFFLLTPEVSTLDGVVFTDTNAATTSRPQQRGEGLQGLSLVNFGAIRSSPRPWDKNGWFYPVQAEVLIPDRLDLRFVSEVGFLSDASLEEGRRLWGADVGPPFFVRPLLFSDTPPSLSLSFPYLAKVMLTDEAVDKTTINRLRVEKKHFRRATCDRITLVASVRAVAGSTAEVTWQPAGVVHATEFETTSEYWHWPSIPIRNLPNGRCSVEYRLGRILWATLEFEVVS
jgi:hypothetical protein